MDITLEEAFYGTTSTLQIGERRIEARIPPGAKSGSRIRLARPGSTAGNLYVVVNVLPHPLFGREGADLHTQLPVDIYTAALGGEVSVATLEKQALLQLPAPTQAGQVF